MFRLNHERFRWRVGNAELFFHEIEVDRALRRAMLLKLLLGIASAVEESLTSQGRVALFFTHSAAHTIVFIPSASEDLAHAVDRQALVELSKARSSGVPRRLRHSG